MDRTNLLLGLLTQGRWRSRVPSRTRRTTPKGSPAFRYRLGRASRRLLRERGRSRGSARARPPACAPWRRWRYAARVPSGRRRARGITWRARCRADASATATPVGSSFCAPGCCRLWRSPGRASCRRAGAGTTPVRWIARRRADSGTFDRRPRRRAPVLKCTPTPLSLKSWTIWLWTRFGGAAAAFVLAFRDATTAAAISASTSAMSAVSAARRRHSRISSALSFGGIESSARRFSRSGAVGSKSRTPWANSNPFTRLPCVVRSLTSRSYSRCGRLASSSSGVGTTTTRQASRSPLTKRASVRTSLSTSTPSDLTRRARRSTATLAGSIS